MDELEARLRAMMRRAAGQASPVIRHADLEVDPAARTIRQAGQKVEVSPREFAVLWALLLARGRSTPSRSISTAGAIRWSNAVEVYVLCARSWARRSL
jgi:two-component system OmpR family response regulator/two-component system response regulator QseB